MVALLTAEIVLVSGGWGSERILRGDFLMGWKLTRRLVRLRDKRPRSAMQLTASVEDEFVRRHASIAHSAGHIVGGAGDDEIAKEGLTLPERAVEFTNRIKLVEAVEERLLGVGE